MTVVKNKLSLAFVISLLAFCFGQNAAAQTFTIDTDIYTLRNNAIPHFRYHYDDYFQYVPAGVMVGLKAMGHESRSSWEQMLVSDAFSAAIMAAAVNGVKYSVGRLRPDGTRYNSFPSGHTATTFMSATMLYKEYGWRYPALSIGGYTIAAVTGVSRIMNNRHWLTDVIAGAAVGIGSVHLGYYLGDLLFGEKHKYDGYVKPTFAYDSSEEHYVAELMFARRFVLGSDEATLPFRGSLAGVSMDVPVVPGIGVTARTSANTLIYQWGASTSTVYNALAGGYYNWHFAKRFELQGKALAGYAWQDARSTALGYRAVSGWDLCAGLGISLMLDSNFRLKAFSEFETMNRRGPGPWLNSVVLGFSSAWSW